MVVPAQVGTISSTPRLPSAQTAACIPSSSFSEPSHTPQVTFSESYACGWRSWAINPCWTEV
ncbi:Transcription factor involved in chromatin remodeling [Pseudomonas syringae pv. actinidiae]|uniref:Transcription factor involved in chromatin remodeling n=1 Tax=Pseudomonas syringae pv. actinidiae TaxID=103796 RepID=A0A2V0QPK7_PSESF|nr:Transcription factor involved in chromatin remodeling [Pseudomonas syringae pv. actinidiae]